MTMILSVLILQNFGKFTGKSVAESLFEESCRQEICNYIERDTLS